MTEASTSEYCRPTLAEIGVKTRFILKQPAKITPVVPIAAPIGALASNWLCGFPGVAAEIAENFCKRQGQIIASLTAAVWKSGIILHCSPSVSI